MQLNWLILVFLINIVYGIVNNVCPTYKDYYTIQSNPRCWYDVAAEQNATNVIRSYGYGVEVHKVVTTDGYILTLFRILNYNLDTQGKVPVLLQHGFLCSGACFIGRGKNSLGFTLADAGYDVWLGNMRGTEYSEKHLTLTKDDIAFWNFNVDDISLYDVPAQLTYISKVNSSNSKIIYIGHSLGTTTALTYAATFPQKAQSLVKLFILLAPNGGIKHTKSVFLRISSLIMDSIVKLYINTEIAKSLANNGSVDKLTTSICLKTPKLMKTCVDFINAIFMGPQDETDASVVPILFNQFPAGSGLRVIKQIAESTAIGFTAYDFGTRNFEKYGSLQPPTYNVHKIKVPIYMVYSRGDWCVTTMDSEILYNKLAPQSKIYGKLEILDKGFNHNDFVFGRTAKTILYNKLVQLMNNVN